MSRKIRRSCGSRQIKLLLIALLSAGCGPGGAENDPRLRLMGGDGGNQPQLPLARGPGAATVCADPPASGAPRPVTDQPLPLFPARGVQSATLSMPFAAADGPGRSCDITLTARPLGSNDGTGPRFDYRRCSILVRGAARGRSPVLIAPRQEAETRDPSVLSECVYRLAMDLEGYRGALTEPSEAMFQDRRQNPQFAGLPWVGPEVPWLPRLLALRCPQLPRLYYGENLLAAVKRTCPKALEPRSG